MLRRQLRCPAIVSNTTTTSRFYSRFILTTSSSSFRSLKHQTSTSSVCSPVSIPRELVQSRFSSLSSSISITTKRVALDDGRVFDGPFFISTDSPAPGCKLTDGTDSYTGEYNDVWQRHGKGKAILDNGQTTYEGTFHEDEFVDGTVKTQDENGDLVVYTGTLRDNRFLKGTLRHKEYSYSGGFENNEPHGKDGVLKFATGAVQEGTFFRGKLHGDKCKWRLESGQVYLGNFVHGVITSGELRTPEFTYEGEFNERGQAHGVGRQEHHATTPRLIFKGHWASGSLVTGQCHTEDGQPIDWQNNSAMQDQLSTKSQQVMQSYIRSKFDEARSSQHEADRRFAEDSDVAYSKTGKRPDPIDLGYETGPVKAAKMQQEKSAKVSQQEGVTRARAVSEAEELAKQEAMLKKAFDENQKRQFGATSQSSSVLPPKSPFDLATEKFNEFSGGSMRVVSSSSGTSDNENDKTESGPSTISAEDIVNWDLARSSLIKQRGKQMATSDTIGDQFERFKLKKAGENNTQQQNKKKLNITNFSKSKSQLSDQQEEDFVLDDGDNNHDELLSADVLKKTKNLGRSRFQDAGDADEDVVVEPISKDALSAKPDRMRVDGNEPFVGVAAKNNIN